MASLLPSNARARFDRANVGPWWDTGLGYDSTSSMDEGARAKAGYLGQMPLTGGAARDLVPSIHGVRA